MPKLTKIRIQNFRSCRDTELPLTDLTPLVGCNNSGKSNIMAAMKWLLNPAKAPSDDFQDADEAVAVSGRFEGIEGPVLELLDQKHRKKIAGYCPDGCLGLRKKQEPGEKATHLVRDPKVADDAAEDAWTAIPTGIFQSIQALFPEPVEVPAMQNVPEDVAKAKGTTTIQRLINAILDPLVEAHGDKLKEALGQIRQRLTADGEARADELKQFDKGANEKLQDLFPGVEVRLHVPPPEVTELFKAGTIKVYEDGSNDGRSIDALGHGAQRSIQMALIRHLAELKGKGETAASRTLLLVDEPELYLHPQAVELVRVALKVLSTKGYQVAFSTHSPQMIRDDHDILHTVIVHKDADRGTHTLLPMDAAMLQAVDKGKAQRRVLMELGNAAQVLFSQTVLLVEGQTEQAVVPDVFKHLDGETLDTRKIGMAGPCSSSGLVNARKIIKAMSLPVKAIADLDFAFQHAEKAGLLSGCEDEMKEASKVFKGLAASNPSIKLDARDLPVGGKGAMKPRDVYVLFAQNKDGRAITKKLHDALLQHDLWLWELGAIEQHLDITGKDECAWHDYRELLANDGDKAIKDLPGVRRMVGWLKTP